MEQNQLQLQDIRKRKFASKFVLGTKVIIIFHIIRTVLFIALAIMYDLHLINHLINYISTYSLFNSIGVLARNIWQQKDKLLPTVIVIWTTVIAMLTLLVDKIDDRTYGIRRIHILLAINPKRKTPVFLLLVATHLAEPFLWCYAVACDMKALFVVVVELQLWNLLIATVIVYMGYYRTAIQEIIRIQTKQAFSSRIMDGGSVHLLIYDMASKLNYYDEEEVDVFIDILFNSAMKDMLGSAGRRHAAHIFELIFSGEYAYNNYSNNIAKQAFSQSDIPIDVQKGIIQFLLKDPLKNYKLCSELILLSSGKKENECARNVELYYWCIMWLYKDLGLSAEFDLIIQYCARAISQTIFSYPSFNGFDLSDEDHSKLFFKLYEEIRFEIESKDSEQLITSYTLLACKTTGGKLWI